MLLKAFRNIYTPVIMHKFTRPVIMITFVMWFLSSILVLPEIDLGLEQELAMSSDSYLLNYFRVILSFIPK